MAEETKSFWERAVDHVAQGTKDVAAGRTPTWAVDQLDKLGNRTEDFLAATAKKGTSHVFNTGVYALGLQKEFNEFKDSKLGVALTHEVNRYTRDFLEQVHQVLTEWYADPVTLCCLIRLLGIIEKQEIKENHPLTFLRTLEAILGITADFLDNKLEWSLNLSFDMLSSAFNLLIAGVIGIINAGLDNFAEDFYKKLTVTLKLTDDTGEQTGLGKCIPFDELLKSTITYFTGDFGILDYFKRFIRDFMSKLRKDFSQYNDELTGSLSYIKQVEFIRRMKNLVRTIADAIERGEICLEMDFDQVQVRDLLYRDPAMADAMDLPASELVEKLDEDSRNKVPSALMRKPAGATSTGGTATSKRSVPSIASEGELRTFYQRNLGYSDERVEQAMKTATYVLDCGQEVTKDVYETYSKVMEALSKTSKKGTGN